MQYESRDFFKGQVYPAPWRRRRNSQLAPRLLGQLRVF